VNRSPSLQAGPLPGVVRPFGDAAFVLALESPTIAAGTAEAIREQSWPGVEDVVPGLRSVVVSFDPLVASAEAIVDELQGLEPRHRRPSGSRTVRIPVVFDGEDLEEVVRITGLRRAQVVEMLTNVTLEVAVVGFSPGFAYLAGLPPALCKVPRRSEPRPRVPAGAVAIAGGHAAVYPQATPGGWHLVGRSELTMFDPATAPYALLKPGDRVRFDPVEPRRERSGARDVPAPPRKVRAPWRATDKMPTFVVEDPGIFTTVQDRGRIGFAHLGVPRSGPADPVSFRLANALVGNPVGAATLEVTARGPCLACRAPAYVAVVGGGPEVWIDATSVAPGRVVPVLPGQRLRIGQVRSGLRAYLAVAGGFDLPPVMGSRSSDVLTAIGPGALRVGDELCVGVPKVPLASHVLTGAPGQHAHGGRRRVRVVLGPHHEWFSARGEEPAHGIVGAASNRVGVGLELAAGPVPGWFRRRLVRELESQAMVTGAIQVPPGRGPIALLNDHATMGGYPVAATVISADLGEIGQCRPGDEVEVVPVSIEEARSARAALERALQRAVVGRYPLGQPF